MNTPKFVKKIHLMLTIFSIPKSFSGHIDIIQRNAIQSWTHLRPKPEVILYGNEVGIKEIAEEFGISHYSNVSCNEYGTPLLNHVFKEVGKISKNNLVCYINADVILLNDFVDAIKRIKFPKYVMVGQRWDIDLADSIDFSAFNWENRLREHVREYGKIHPPSGSDYFVFPWVEELATLPAFAVGRPGWDNWFIYNARRLGIPVIDATRITKVIHQNHDYSHIKSQKNNAKWEGPEADLNRQLMTHLNYFTLLDATHTLNSKFLLPAFYSKYLQRRFQTLPVFFPFLRPFEQLWNRINFWLESLR